MKYCIKYFTSIISGNPHGCCYSIAKSRPTLCDPMGCSNPGLYLANSWSLLKLMSADSVALRKCYLVTKPSFTSPSSYNANYKASYLNKIFKWTDHLQNYKQQPPVFILSPTQGQHLPSGNFILYTKIFSIIVCFGLVWLPDILAKKQINSK